MPSKLPAVVLIGLAASVLGLAMARASRYAAADEAAVREVESRLVAAWGRGDAAAVGAMLADDFQHWSFSGARRGKAELMKTVAGSGAGETVTEDAVVRVYGDAAVYTARLLDRSAEGDSARTCVTDVFIRRAGRWVMVASHETLLPADAVRKP